MTYSPLSLPQHRVLMALMRGQHLKGCIRWRTGGKRAWSLFSGSQYVGTVRDDTVRSLALRGYLTRLPGERGTGWKTMVLTPAAQTLMGRFIPRKAA